MDVCIQRECRLASGHGPGVDHTGLMMVMVFMMAMAAAVPRAVPATTQRVMVPAVAVGDAFVNIHPAGMAWRDVWLARIAVPAVAAVVKHPHAGQPTPVTRAKCVACVMIVAMPLALDHQGDHACRLAIEGNVQRLGAGIRQ